MIAYCPECELILDESEVKKQGVKKMCSICETETYDTVPAGFTIGLSSAFKRTWAELMENQKVASFKKQETDQCGCEKGMCMCIDYTTGG